MQAGHMTMEDPRAGGCPTSCRFYCFVLGRVYAVLHGIDIDRPGPLRIDRCFNKYGILHCTRTTACTCLGKCAHATMHMHAYAHVCSCVHRRAHGVANNSYISRCAREHLTWYAAAATRIRIRARIYTCVRMLHVLRVHAHMRTRRSRIRNISIYVYFTRKLNYNEDQVHVVHVVRSWFT